MVLRIRGGPVAISKLATMGDSKQVRVDNWGTYFLQRLQQFFNKTDYCDLTLQFEGNVQLKVHRLVISACTEYFHVLEQTCEVSDDVLVMPPDLQADVILPIVNFMYTGILEFQVSTFDKLYKTADLMNIPVLTKLLDAQRKPIMQSKHRKSSWGIPKKVNIKPDPDLPATLPGRKLPVWKRKTAPVPQSTPISEPKYKQDPLFMDPPKPTRFEWPEEDSSLLFNMMDSSFTDISYTSKPLLTQDDAQKNSTFDSIKHLPSQNKKAKVQESHSTIDMEDMKDYIKEQKIRSDLIEYDDDDVDNDLGSFEPTSPKSEGQGAKRKSETSLSASTKKVRFSVLEKENKTTINVSPGGNIADMNHTKLISEVLKKYPHLVKKNKNIKLKILAKSPTKGAEIKVQTMKSSDMKVVTNTPKMAIKSVHPKTDTKKEGEGPWSCAQCISNGDNSQSFNLYYLYLKHISEVHNEKIDALICKFCGHKSTRLNLLMYHQYTKHGVKPPPSFKFPKCNQCPYIAVNDTILEKHKMNHLKFDYECAECKIAFNNITSLQSHMQITAHSAKSGKTNFDCQYCTKKYQHGGALFAHIKAQHHDEAKRDGVISIDEGESYEESQDEMEGIDETEMFTENQERSKTPKEIKIISNVKVPHNLTPQTTEVQKSSEAEALSNVASGIATSLGLVDIVVLDENQQYILHSNDQQLQEGLTNTNNQFILPDISDPTFSTNQQIGEHNVITQSMLNNSDITSTDELVMVLTDHDYQDGNNEILNNENSNIVVLYSHPVEGQENQYITSQGNIMLNQQTGMLEIRNTIPDPPTTEPMVIPTEETHIESIEMIQREINSHQETKADESSTTTIMTTLASTVEPLTSNTAILENDIIPNQAGVSVPLILDEGQGMDELKTADLAFEQGSLIVDGSGHGQSAAEGVPQSVREDGVKENEEGRFGEEDAMEIDEECKNEAPMMPGPQILEPTGNQEIELISSNSAIQQDNLCSITETNMEVQPEKDQENEDGLQMDVPLEPATTEHQETMETQETLVQNEEEAPVEAEVGMTMEPTESNELPQDILEDMSETNKNQQENEEKKGEEASIEENKVVVQEVKPVEENISQDEQANQDTQLVKLTEDTEINTQDEDNVSMYIESTNDSVDSAEVERQNEETSKRNPQEEIMQLENTLLESQRNILQTQDDILETQQLIEDAQNENAQVQEPQNETEGIQNSLEITENETNDDHANDAALNNENIEENENMGMDTENIELNNENVGLDSENSGLNNENVGLNNENIGLNNENIGLENENVGLHNENIDLNNENIGLDNENVGLNNEIINNENINNENINNENMNNETGLNDNELVSNDQSEDIPQEMSSQDVNLNDATTNDEVSQESQDEASQISSTDTKEMDANFSQSISSETTKIAILDDWEDTDSQPSDQGEANKSVNVNKIIDDWADDEDEAK